MEKKIGILMENRFIEREIYYYMSRFAEEGYEVVLLTRLWGQNQLTFKGLELQGEITVNHSFENMTDEDLSDYVAIIAPAGYVSDYLLYAEHPCETSPAADFIKAIMSKKDLIKAFICHSLWIAGPVSDSFKGRKVTCHNNIISHVKNAGMIYVDSDISVDDDLITARTGGDHALLSRTIIRQLEVKR